jgi:hypothetical protein
MTRVNYDIQNLQKEQTEWTEESQLELEAEKCLSTQATDEEMESETDHQEVLKEGAVVEQVDGRKKRQRGRNLAARRRRTDPV